jgi:hypothetical protein
MWVGMIAPIEAELDMPESESIPHVFDEWIEYDPYASALRQ